MIEEENSSESRLSKITKESINYALIKTLKESISEFKQDNKGEHEAFLKAIERVADKQENIEKKLDSHIPEPIMILWMGDKKRDQLIIKVLLLTCFPTIFTLATLLMTLYVNTRR